MASLVWPKYGNVTVDGDVVNMADAFSTCHAHLIIIYSL